jgi:hypothetical protein
VAYWGSPVLLEMGHRGQVTENEGSQAEVVEGESGGRPDEVPLTARLLLRESLTARQLLGSSLPLRC